MTFLEKEGKEMGRLGNVGNTVCDWSSRECIVDEHA